MTTVERRRAVPYMPWRTLLTALDILGEHGLPEQIDRSVFQTFSGATQAELLAGMRALGLLNEKGEPTELLAKLVDAKAEDRRPIIHSIISDAYFELIAADLTKTTPTLLNERLEKWYTVSGSTKKKALRFFLSAAEYAQIPLSPRLSMPRAAGGSSPGNRRRRVAVKATNGTANATAPSPTVAPGPSSAMKTVSLKSGGTLTISGSFNPFDLEEADRKFIDGLIRFVQAYESDSRSSPTE